MSAAKPAANSGVGTNLRLESHRQIPSDPRLRPAWNALVDQMERPEVFYTWEWAKAVEFAYSSALPPWLILAYESDQLVGLASLTLSAENRASFLAATTADYCDVLSRPERRADLLEAIFVKLHSAGCHQIVLANLPKDSATAASLETVAKRHGFHPFARPAYECAQVNLGNGEARQELASAMSRKKSFRRNMNGLRREGVVHLTHLTSWSAVEPILPRFARAHVGRFLSMGRISNLVRGERRAFLHELARRLSESQSLDLTRLMVNDRPIAWNYGFRFRGSWFWYQPTFDSRLAHYAPGAGLLASMIIEACSTPELQFVDLGLGAEGYKERFANGIRTTVYVTIADSATEVARERLRYRIAEQVKKSPNLEASIRKQLERAATVRRRLRQGPRAFATWAGKVAARRVGSVEEVRFYQWPEGGSASRASAGKTCALEPADFDLLGQTAMTYEKDSETLAYLLRAAQRLNGPNADGYVLLDSEQRPVHLCWAGAFEGFEMAEIQARLTAPSESAAMIFDCWTPVAARGHGYYANSIATLATRLEQQRRKPWIFSAATNAASIRGIEAAGFVYRYCMVSHRRFGRNKIDTVPDPNA